MINDWAGFLWQGTDDEEQALLRRDESTGRPLGSKKFVRRLEKQLGRKLCPQKGGRPRKG